MILITEILIFLSFGFAGIYFWMNHRYSYWKRKNVPYIEPTPFIGNFKDTIFMIKSTANKIQELYNHKNAENQPVVGIYIFHKPGLLIREPELIKRIFVKDFNKFSNRYSKAEPHGDPLASYNLFFIKNPSWKIMRSKLSPTFTSGKMKQMFSLINDIGKQLDSYLCDLTTKSEKKSICIECKETCALFTTDVIASTAFGVEANSLKNPEGDFRKNGRKLTKFTTQLGFNWTITFFLPQLVSLFKCKLFMVDVAAFIRNSINYVMKEREKSGLVRNDLIDTLITLKNASIESKEKNEEVKFQNDVLIAQAAVFYFAGFETTSSVMSFTLYETCKNQEVQNRLRDEIKRTFENNNGELTYDAVQGMEYLNMVVQETLRMYPPLPFLDRECTLTNDDDDKDGYSLEPFSDFKIPNGMPVYIPMYALQRDPKYFHNPDVFDPERFNAENKTSGTLSGVYMPFGIGPHNCIGERFGLLETKIGLIHFFKNHLIRMAKNTPKVLEFEKKALLIQSTGGISMEIVNDPLF